MFPFSYPQTRQPQNGGLVPNAYWRSRGLTYVYLGNRSVWTRAAGYVAPITSGGPKVAPYPQGLATGIGALYGTGTTDLVNGGVVPAIVSGSRSWVTGYFLNSTGGGGFGRVFDDVLDIGAAGESIYPQSNGMGLTVYNPAAANFYGWYSQFSGVALNVWTVFGVSQDRTSTTSANALQFYTNGVRGITATGTAATQVITPMVTNLRVGNRPTDNLRSLDGRVSFIYGFDGFLTAQEHADLAGNPWKIFQPIARNIWIPTAAVVSISRPTADVTTTGWTGNPDNVTLFTNINETTPSNSEFIESPNITGGEFTTFNFLPTRPAGTWDVTFHARFTGASAQARIHLLDGSNVSQGVSAWQTVTSSFVPYVASVTTTGTSSRVKIEVQ